MPRFENYHECASFFSLHEPEPANDFCGFWEEHYPHGQLKYRGKFYGNRERRGQHVLYYENGNVQELSTWHEGWPVGTWSIYSEEGYLMTTIELGELGAKASTYIEKVFSTQFGFGHVETYVSRPYSIRAWKDGELVWRWACEKSKRYSGPGGEELIYFDALKIVFPEMTFEEFQELSKLED